MVMTLRARHRAVSQRGTRIALLAGLGLLSALSAATARAQTCVIKPSAPYTEQSCYSMNPSEWPPPARPYFMVVFDVSGSMIACTKTPTDGTTWNRCMSTAPKNSCNLLPSRINDGKCALRKMVQAFSEVDFGLTTFTQTITSCGTTSPYLCTPYVVDGTMPELANQCQVSGACNGTSGVNATGGTVQVKLPLDANTLTNMIKWTDDDCASGVELMPAGPTPINGALRDAGRHLRANAASLLPKCRPVNVILITDGAETCDGASGNQAALAAQDLYNNGLNDPTRKVKVYPIGFGGLNSTEITALNEIAKMGQCGALTGTCAAGVTALTANNEAELSQKLSAIISGAVAPEECDNQDNNCNGCVDEGYLHYCNTNPVCCVWATGTQRDACLASFKATLDPTKLPCTTASQNNDCTTWLCYDPKDVCDNADNNCSQGVDEGALKCNGHCPQAETCNDQDDDCDGVVDEKDGSNVPYSIIGCLKCNKTAEICDGCDNDCDGIADNGVAPLTCGLPEPSNCIGSRSCKPPQQVGTPGGCLSGGPGDFWGSCVMNIQTEVCDGVDNDCDGTIDENIAPTLCEVPNTPGLKYQQDGFATSQCKKGTQPCTGQCSGYIGPSTEICDGIDNDCDGSVDEGILPGVGLPCGVQQGICTKGTSSCLSGALVCLGGAQPQPELCNGIDDDCDGSVDDNPIDAPSATDKPCWNLPPNGCNPVCSYLTTQWCAPPGAGCHDLGTIMSPPCALGQLSCLLGKWQCVGGLAPSAEICDSVDNNCDGTADNELPSNIPCGVAKGECVPGVEVCNNGLVECQGATLPTTEVCNNKDDDCDGTIDNGIALGESCWVDYDKTLYPGPRENPICKPGVTECDANGLQVCKNGVGPKPEVCNAIDDDCDGMTDEEGPPPDGITGTADPNDATKVIGADCGKNLGQCKPGKWACNNNGQLYCSGAVLPQPEVCNCLDDDCDGLVDEDPTSANEPALCGTGKVCVSYKGDCQCAGPCGPGEWPCGTQKCEINLKKSGTGEDVGSRCVSEPCGDCAKETVTKSDGDGGNTIVCAPAGSTDTSIPPPVCVCKGQAKCQNPCYGVTCPTAGTLCTDYGSKPGTCVADNCYNFPCPTGKACHTEDCVDNPCKPNSCPPDKVCRPDLAAAKFTCVGSCAGVTCGIGEVCEDGACKKTGCASDCPTGKVCQSADGGAGTCVDSKCKPDSCSTGAYCDPLSGTCGDDPCSGVLCPAGQQCIARECVKTALDGGVDTGTGGSGGGGGTGGSGQAGGGGQQVEDGGPGADDKGRFGLATGGGGCACKVGGAATRNTGGALALAVAGFGLLAARRRRRTGPVASCVSTKVRGGDR